MNKTWCILQQLYAIMFLIIWLSCSALAAYWLFLQPSNILSNTLSPVIVNDGFSNIAIAGQTIFIDRFFCINNDKIKGDVTRIFSNHVVYQLPDTISFDNGIGCRKKRYVVDIPSVLPSGEYEYRVHIMYKLNPLKTVTYQLTPVSLNIVNPVWDKIKELTNEKN